MRNAGTKMAVQELSNNHHEHFTAKDSLLVNKAFVKVIQQ